MKNIEQTNEPAAYMVAFVRVEDEERFRELYLKKSVQIVAKYGGETVAVEDSPNMLEGELPAGRLVILKFPSKRHAEGFYHAPEYQPLKAVRKKMSQSDSLIVEGLL